MPQLHPLHTPTPLPPIHPPPLRAFFLAYNTAQFVPPPPPPCLYPCCFFFLDTVPPDFLRPGSLSIFNFQFTQSLLLAVTKTVPYPSLSHTTPLCSLAALTTVQKWLTLIYMFIVLLSSQEQTGSGSYMCLVAAVTLYLDQCLPHTRCSISVSWKDVGD